MDSIIFLLGTTLLYSSPMIFTAIGGMMSERAGVVNIGVDGLMTLGAFTGAAIGYYTGNPWLAFLLAGLISMAVSVFHAIATVNFAANHTVAGSAMNFFAMGVAVFMCKQIFDGSASTPQSPMFPKLFGDLIPSDSYWSYLNVRVPVVLALVLVILVYVLLYKTKWGLRIRAVGENPAVAETMGINAKTVKFVCVLLSGLFAGFGGATMTLSVISQFSAFVVIGQGFLGLGAVILGKWKPWGTYFACLLFAFAHALVMLLGFGGLLRSTLPSHYSMLFAMLPFVITLIALVIAGKSNDPRSNALPYIRNFH